MSSPVPYMQPTFHIVDYIVFAGFLCISGVVGIYFSVKGHKNTSDYFFGGRQMGAVPIGISNGVSFLSALVLVGTPSEIYINGYDMIFDPIISALSYFSGGALIACVIYPLGMSSLSEYFSKRFNSKVLTHTANVMVLLCIFEYMGACMLGSVIAMNSVTGGQVSVVLGLIIAGAVGTFYTSIGGLKAVVWTDVIQCGFMLLGIITVVVKSIMDTPGGMTTIIEMNKKYERIHPFSWSANPTVRHTVWGLLFGRFIYLIMYPIHPAGVQRLCSAKTRRDSFIVAGIAGLLSFLFVIIPLWAGTNIFGYYASRGCDIFRAGWIEKNEILVYYVRERLNFPGFQGFFVASLFSGSLSSFSSGLSAASAILWNDTIKPLLPFEVSELKATLVSKVLVVIFGVLSMMWCYALYSFGGLIFQVTSSIDASMYGAYFALFLFALFFRYGNWKGAMAGLVVSFAFTLWLGLGSLLHGQTSVINWPTTIEQCQANMTANVSVSILLMMNSTAAKGQQAAETSSLIEFLYSISYVWLPTLCVATSLLVSLFTTGCTKQMSKERLRSEYLFPLCRPGGSCSHDTESLVSEEPYESESDEEKRKMCNEADYHTASDSVV